MTLGSIVICMIVCLFCRCIIFYKRDEKWYKAIIPGYNKYILGKISNNKKIGCINAIVQSILQIFFMASFTFELWLIQTYSTQANISTNTNVDSQVELAVPKNIANIAIYSKYVLIVLAVICLIVWCIMMWKFTMIHKRNSWFIVLWALIPVIPYIIFAISNDVVIDGKMYTMKRVEKI